jgi:hypothetical protein
MIIIIIIIIIIIVVVIIIRLTSIIYLIFSTFIFLLSILTFCNPLVNLKSIIIEVYNFIQFRLYLFWCISQY